MPKNRPVVAGIAGVLSAVAALVPADRASAEELRLDDVIVTQAIRYSNTPLIAGNVTFVRAIITTPDTASPVANVDAACRVFVDGVEASFSPLRSINGPIVSPPAPNPLTLGDHVNFWFVAPQSADVDIEVIVNPGGIVPNDDPANNVMTVEDLDFECRAEVDLAYVPINYTIGGGLPDPELIQPGIGDAFVRAIFPTGAWNYFESPTGQTIWNQNVNGSSSALLNRLRDIRLNQIPGLGYPRPEFVYGWLPGNPFNGNGVAIGIPGDVAFGNTQVSRHQRTFAHELGHLLDEPHNGENVGQVGIDVEHLLFRPLGLPQMIESGKNDIMVAGQLTDTAFVSNPTYIQTLGDNRLQCDGLADAGDDPVLRVSGVFTVATRAVELDPVTWIEEAPVDESRVDGEVIVVARDAAGLELHRVRAVSGRTALLCSSTPQNPQFATDLSLHATIPAEVDGRAVARVEVLDRLTGALLASRDRSASAPEVAFTSIAGVQADEGADLEPDRLRLEWTASDADGDDLEHVLLFSPNRDAWLPVDVRIDGTALEVAFDDLPGRGRGWFRLVTTDGMNHAIADSPPVALAGGGNAPEVFVLTPRGTSAFGKEANIVLHAFGWDLEDRSLDGEITWFSSLEGALGSGRLIQVQLETPGIHTIIATATDSDGMTDVDTVLIGIEDRPLPPLDGIPADLDGDGEVGFGDLVILLAAWGPCPGGGDPCAADLDGDGEVGFADLLELIAAWG